MTAIIRPKFYVRKITKNESILMKEQEPVLQKLDELGYGLYIEKDFYMPLPAYLEEEHFPFDLCQLDTEEKVVVQNWDELIKLIE